MKKIFVAAAAVIVYGKYKMVRLLQGKSRYKHLIVNKLIETFAKFS